MNELKPVMLPNTVIANHFSLQGFLGNEPYLITKDLTNRIHYFINICRTSGGGMVLCRDERGDCYTAVLP